MKFVEGTRVQIQVDEHESCLPQDIGDMLDGATGTVLGIVQDGTLSGSVRVKLDEHCAHVKLGGLDHVLSPHELCPLVKIVVELEIAGDAAEAETVVDELLDAGIFQDAINDHEVDDAGDLHVTSAVCHQG